MIIAPLSADSMAKMVAGFCDSLLLSTVRAWDTTGKLDFPHTVGSSTWPSAGEGGARKKILVAPAMNTAMWVHPLSKKHVEVLEEWEWVEVLRPVEKELACGDVGGGAMCSWEKIVERIIELVS